MEPWSYKAVTSFLDFERVSQWQTKKQMVDDVTSITSNLYATNIWSITCWKHINVFAKLKYIHPWRFNIVGWEDVVSYHGHTRRTYIDFGFWRLLIELINAMSVGFRFLTYFVSTSFGRNNYRNRFVLTVSSKL